MSGIAAHQRDYEHGTRACYVKGCRCADCRAANLRYYHERMERRREAETKVAPFGQPIRGTLVRAGKVYQVLRCPGAGWQPCVVEGGAWLRGSHRVCKRCVERATVWNGLIDAKRARDHLRALSRRGIGRDTVADIAGVAVTVINDIRSGAKKQIRASTERALFRVTTEAVNDGSVYVDARPTWKLIERLTARDVGFTKAEIARRLGYGVAALQFRKKKIKPATARKVRRFYDSIMVGA